MLVITSLLCILLPIILLKAVLLSIITTGVGNFNRKDKTLKKNAQISANYEFTHDSWRGNSGTFA